MGDRILVVDDDRLLLDALVRELGRRFHLDTATSAEEALEKLRRNGPYAVVLTDLHMPGTDGITLLDEVRRRWPDTVRMMFTGRADREKVIEALNTGYLFRFLDKPCSRDTMACVLRDALDQHQRILAARELEAVKKQKEALEKVVMGFTRLVEARDPYTAGHQKRVPSCLAPWPADWACRRNRPTASVWPPSPTTSARSMCRPSSSTGPASSPRSSST